MYKKNLHLAVTAALLGTGLACNTAFADDSGHELELKLRTLYWKNAELPYASASAPNPQAVKYEQGVVASELNYRSPFWAGIVGFDASGYGVRKLIEGGRPTAQVLEPNNHGQLQDGFLTLGQAFLKLKLGEMGLVKVGRQTHDSLLLKSTNTRAVPDTFSGANVAISPVAGLRIQAAVYDQWKSRTTGEFEKFRTEAAANNAIDYVSILGATYASGPLSVNAEVLNSKSYLTKTGLVVAYGIPIQATELKLSSGVLTSRSAGARAVCGAEAEMDCTGTGRTDNKGTGYYVDANWKLQKLTLGFAAAKFDGFWIEDNFAVNGLKTGALTQDHGTNPFPTSSGIGPDLTNNDELVLSARVGYDWSDYVKGLKTAFKYSRGTGAHPSNLNTGAEGREIYRELDVGYQLPLIKNLGVRYVYLNYDSNVAGGPAYARIKGMTRQEWEQHRFYIDYAYRF